MAAISPPKPGETQPPDLIVEDAVPLEAVPVEGLDMAAVAVEVTEVFEDPFISFPPVMLPADANGEPLVKSTDDVVEAAPKLWANLGNELMALQEKLDAEAADSAAPVVAELVFEPEPEQTPEPPIETGLVFDHGTRRLLDPETGEMFVLVSVVDDATAEAACSQIGGNNYAIDRIDQEIARLEKLKKTRERRREWLKLCYLDGLIKAADAKMKREKLKTQSVSFTYATVGWASSRKSTKVVDKNAATKWALKEAPESVRLEVDLQACNKVVRELLRMLAFDESGQPAPGISGSVQTSVIPDELKVKLPADAFTFNPGGEPSWYIK